MSEKVERKPIYKKWWFWVIIVVAFFVIVGSNDTTQQPETTLTLGETNTINSTSNSNSTTQSKKYSVGEIYQDNDMAVKYVSLNEDFTGYSKYADIKEGCKIIKAEFEAENLGTADLYFSAYNFSCYADGYDCESFWSVEDSGFSSSLSSKKKAKGAVYFQVPKDAQSIVIEYDINAFTGKKIEFNVR